MNLADVQVNHQFTYELLQTVRFISILLCSGHSIRQGIHCTRFENASQVFDNYFDSYWSDYPRETVHAVLMELWPRVYQPRFNDERGHTIAHGYWFNHEAGALEWIK